MSKLLTVASLILSVASASASTGIAVNFFRTPKHHPVIEKYKEHLIQKKTIEFEKDKKNGYYSVWLRQEKLEPLTKEFYSFVRDYRYKMSSILLSGYAGIEREVLKVFYDNNKLAITYLGRLMEYRDLEGYKYMRDIRWPEFEKRYMTVKKHVDLSKCSVDYTIDNRFLYKEFDKIRESFEWTAKGKLEDMKSWEVHNSYKANKDFIKSLPERLDKWIYGYPYCSGKLVSEHSKRMWENLVWMRVDFEILNLNKKVEGTVYDDSIDMYGYYFKKEYINLINRLKQEQPNV